MLIPVSPRITLRQFHSSLAEDFHRAIHRVDDATDPFRCRLQEKYPTLEAVEARVRDAVENKYSVDGTPDFFIYVDGQVAGIFEFHPIRSPAYVEVGFWLFADYRRQGILSAVFPAMLDYARAYQPYPALYATTLEKNVAAQRLLEKFQFEKTGRILEFPEEGEEPGAVQREVEYLRLWPDEGGEGGDAGA